MESLGNALESLHEDFPVHSLLSRSRVTAKASQVMSCIYVIEALGLNESQCSRPPQAVQWKVNLHM